jgi:UDP-N-acetyl-D-galactosamine dehydrogenase
MHQMYPLAVVGLGYVGLPLAVEFGKSNPVVGFDISESRISELGNGHDRTREVSSKELESATGLSFSHNRDDLRACRTFIVTVPTPIDEGLQPDLTPLRKACELIGSVMQQGATVIFESTVYPGCTEEICVPVLEAVSGMTYNADFYCGYSPERINPGDKVHRLPAIIKVTSGSTPETADRVDRLYASIITAGTHKASSIRVAEASKVIENTQRDLNIALMNELAKIFQLLGIDTQEVLQAAGTKWNFLPFHPGLVGGHCIGVDPYYLTHKAQQIGYHPEVILAGRRVNDGMGEYVAGNVVKLMLGNNVPMAQARVLVLGLTFKEDCPDIRNTKVVDVIHGLGTYNLAVDVYDPWADRNEAKAEYGIDLLETLPDSGAYGAVVLTVAHQAFRDMGLERIRALGSADAVVYDVKSILPAAGVSGRL